jgi:hypothetical protein
MPNDDWKRWIEDDDLLTLGVLVLFFVKQCQQGNTTLAVAMEDLIALAQDLVGDNPNGDREAGHE